MSTPFPKAASNRSAMTLPEVVSVLAVMGTLLAAGVPSLRHLTGNAGRTAAVGEVLGAFEEARCAALASGRPAYLVLADHTAAPGRRCRAYCIYGEEEDFSRPPKALTAWHTLPTGVAFRRDGETPSLLTAPPEAAAPRFAPPGGGALHAYPHVKFGPTGAVEYPAQSQWARLFLFNGETEADGTQTITARKDAPADEIALSLFTGRARFLPPE